MSGEAFLINDPPGTFIVKSLDGGTAFDSRLQTQRIYMVGTADLLGPPNAAVSATYLQVPYGKTFPKIPYVRSVARALDAPFDTSFQNYHPPYMTWTNILVTGQQSITGHYTNANVSSVYLGNAWQSYPNRRLRFLYAIFENPVE